MNTEEPRFPNNLPQKWREHLAPEGEKDYFKSLTKFLKQEYASKLKIFPAQPNILHALKSVDYADVRVVILGQDPYHGEGQAIGKCFAVPNDLKRKPPSLMNIFKEIQSDLNKPCNFSDSELSHWTSQGVLLLNTVLTVRSGLAYSHADKGWERFTDRVISLLNDRSEPIIFILWGAHARKKKLIIDNPQHHIIESAHPSPLSAHNGFFGSKPFSKANAILRKLGKPEIDWAVTK